MQGLHQRIRDVRDTMGFAFRHRARTNQEPLVTSASAGFSRGSHFCCPSSRRKLDRPTHAGHRYRIGVAPVTPSIRYAVTSDGIRIAFFTLGQGPPCVVLFPYHVSHLELNWKVAVHRRGLQFLADHFTVVAIDLRGTGLSERNVDGLSLEAFASDIEVVLAALRIERAAICAMGPSAPIALHFAKRAPQRVPRIVLIQGGESETNRRLLSLRALNPDVETRLRGVLVGGDDSDNAAALAAAARESMSPDVLRHWERLLATTNVEDVATGVAAPTLLLHAADDDVIPLRAGQALAQKMANARFVPLAEAHPMQVWRSGEALREMADWIAAGFGRDARTSRRTKRAAASAARAGLTGREVEVLRLLAAGKTNRQIAATLFISPNTVSHHLRNIFAKSGATNRTQAAAFAHVHRLAASRRASK
jgi:DNA-binding NarL/FixJ family response regulator